MKYILTTKDGMYWTGDRWSEYVGEAMGYTLRVARGKQSEIADRYGFKPKVIERDAVTVRRAYYD